MIYGIVTVTVIVIAVVYGLCAASEVLMRSSEDWGDE